MTTEQSGGSSGGSWDDEAVVRLTPAQVKWVAEAVALSQSIRSFAKYLKTKSFYTPEDAVEHLTNAVKEWADWADDLELGGMAQAFNMAELMAAADVPVDMPNVEME